MIDLHCHILPAVDDGSDSTETSCQMARLAQESCVDTIVATPHCNLPGNQPNYRNQDLSARFEAINRVFRREGIDVKILPGCEDIPYIQTWEQVLKKRGILTIIWVFGANVVAGLVMLIFGR